MFLRNINYLSNKSLEHGNVVLWAGAKAHRKVVVGTGTELAYLTASSLTLRPDFSPLPISNPLWHFTLTSPASSAASHHWASLPFSRRRGSFVLLVGVLLPAFLLLCAWMLSKTASPHFHLRLGIPEERWRSKCFCEIWLVCTVICHRGMEVITREFPQIGGCCGVVPGSFGFLIKS